jgi:hypothetical protein
MKKAFSLSFLLLLLLGGAVKAQDNTAVKVKPEKIPVTGSEKIDFIFTRSVLIGSVEGVSYDVSRSGAYSLGVGYGIPIGKVLEIKLEPRALWHKFYFTNVQTDKWFPTSDSSARMVYEKQRYSYVEVPIALKFKLARNIVAKYQMLIETGFSFGYQIGSTYKHRRADYINANGDPAGAKITTKVNHVHDLNRFRYGPYVRLGTKLVSVYGFYRMSEIFRDGATMKLDDGSSRALPLFPKLEIGLSLTI